MPINFAVKAAVTVAMMAAQTALTMSRKIEGPRLDDTKFTGGDYGASLAMVWGMRRLDVPIFWAEELREVKRRRKTKGGKFNEYTYYGTWAVALAGHEIEAVRRIWFDTHLIYDVSGAGPVTPFDFGANATGAMISDYITIYTGTTTQTADPRMQATVEAEFGEGSCPAYRDTAYIVFKDIPLEKIGNRIPQVSVEMVGAATAAYPYDRVAGGVTGFKNSRMFSSDFATLLTASRFDYTVYDVAARSVIIEGSHTEEVNTATLLDSGDILALEYSTGDRVLLYSIDGALLSVVNPSGDYHDLSVAVDGNGTTHVFLAQGALLQDALLNGSAFDVQAAFGSQLIVNQMFADSAGNVWLLAQDTTRCIFRRIVDFSNDGGPIQIEATVADGDDPVAFRYIDATNDHFVLACGATTTEIYLVDRMTGAVTAGPSLGPTFSPRVAILNLAPSPATFWIANTEYSSVDLSVVRTVSGGSWLSGLSLATTLYDPINHALIAADSGDYIWCYLDRIGSAGVTLGGIATDIAEWCGVEDYDFTALDQTVTGWSATRGSGANMLEPLLDAYDSDIAPHDFTIRGTKRTGTASGATLLTEKFVGDPRYGVTVRQASELPRALLIDFADVDADQQPNSVRSDRPLDATQARGEKKIDLTTLAMNADTARGLADRHFRRVWNERKEISLSLTAQNLALEPGDVRTLALDGDTITARCISVAVGAGDVLATKWRYDTPSLALQDATGGAAFDGRTAQAVAVPLISKGFVLDIPLLTDADDDTVPQAYTLAAPYASGTWPGAVIYREVSSEYTDEIAEVISSAQATWGRVAEVMAYANPNLWDRGTSLTVTLQTGELTGCTEAAANADPSLNLCAIGTDGRWELVQFTNATLTAPLTYTMSGFKRGRRGTEWAAESHAAGDTLVVLDTAAPQDFGLSDVGVAQSFKAITAGRTNGFPFGYTFAGQTLMPYAPTALDGVKDAGSGDWALSWIRRTRIGGAWTSGSTIPLGEATEEYEVDIMNGATVVRTIAALSSAAASYTNAQQVTDFGSTQSSLTFRVYQISATVDRGFMAEATI